MTQSKHTPGPWLTKGAMSNFDKGKESIFVVNGKGDSKRIAQTSKEFNGTETRANARLIAAAPDLLEALEAAEKICPQHTFVPATGQRVKHPIREKIEAAIAKARGEL